MVRFINYNFSKMIFLDKNGLLQYFKVRNIDQISENRFTQSKNIENLMKQFRIKIYCIEKFCVIIVVLKEARKECYNILSVHNYFRWRIQWDTQKIESPDTERNCKMTVSWLTLIISIDPQEYLFLSNTILMFILNF